MAAIQHRGRLDFYNTILFLVNFLLFFKLQYKKSQTIITSFTVDYFCVYSVSSLISCLYNNFKISVMGNLLYLKAIHIMAFAKLKPNEPKSSNLVEEYHCQNLNVLFCIAKHHWHKALNWTHSLSNIYMFLIHSTRRICSLHGY